MTDERNQVSGLSFVGTLFTANCRFDRAAFVNANMQGVQFEDVDMRGARVNNANLSNVAITDANLEGMTINGVLVKDALETFVSGGRRFSQQDNALLPEIYQAKTPQEAANIIVQRPHEEAVDIIDSLDPITAALVIAEFRHREKWPGGSLKAEGVRNYATKLIQLAEQRSVRGVSGIFDARNQVYRETGYLKQA